jgi:hypothetical protein
MPQRDNKEKFEGRLSDSPVACKIEKYGYAQRLLLILRRGFLSLPTLEVGACLKRFGENAELHLEDCHCILGWIEG